MSRPTRPHPPPARPPPHASSPHLFPCKPPYALSGATVATIEPLWRDRRGPTDLGRIGASWLSSKVARRRWSCLSSRQRNVGSVRFTGPPSEGIRVSENTQEIEV